MTSNNVTEGWEDQYPLSTFKGQTKQELVTFIKDLLAKRDRELIEIYAKYGLKSDDDIYQSDYHEREVLSELFTKIQSN